VAISIYEYVASNSPQEARAICNKYGYSIPENANWSDVAQALDDLVVTDGAQPFYDILSLHPDKDVIIERYAGSSQMQPAANASAPAEKKCSCKGKAVDKYLDQGTTGILHQGNLLLIGGILILAVAIVATNK
jgi:hypothetical protein